MHKIKIRGGTLLENLLRLHSTLKERISVGQEFLTFKIVEKYYFGLINLALRLKLEQKVSVLRQNRCLNLLKSITVRFALKPPTP